MSDITIAQAIIYLWTLTLAAMFLGTVAIAFIAWLIVRQLSAGAQERPPVPSFSKVTERAAAAVNGYPQPDVEEEKGESDVAPDPTVSQVLTMSDQQAKSDRDQWWEERRADGLTDDEIAAEEITNVVDLGQG